ncbi:Aminopeptidase PepS [Planctomycetales bacterium 10988]|nr:Aminopeptidase PepS [Planctomycetales bacterium 10988]
MKDSRITDLAKVLIDHSCRLSEGEKVLIEAFDLPEPQLITDLIRLVSERGAHAVVHWKNNAILRALYRDASEKSFDLVAEEETHTMKQMDAYIGIRGSFNSSEFSDVPADRMKIVQERWGKPVHFEIRVPKTKWVVLRYPTPSMAQSAKMSFEAFTDFYFDVCTTDYQQMAKNQEPLVNRMETADQIHIKGPGTDLKFSIKNIPIIPCNGQCNIPDGEVFTAPVKESVQGTIQFNTATLYRGIVFQNIFLNFKDGKIIEATAGEKTEQLNEILDSDDGARYIGEWAIGVNNFIREPMLDILFDEKIGGSFHFTPGNAYDEADNGNRSQVHWDMVLIQTEEKGGGEIWFDDELIRKDGFFLPEDLKPLNEGL